MPRDESMETRMALAEERIKRNAAHIEEAETRMMGAVERVEKACGALGDKLDAALARRSTWRATIIVGLLGAASTLLAHFT